MGMLLIVQLLNVAVDIVDNGLLHVHRVVEEAAHLLQQLQLKAELIAYNLSALERLSDQNITGWDNTDVTRTQQQSLHGEEREKHLVHALQWI